MSIIDVCNTRYTISEAWYAYQFTVACRILVRDSPKDGTKLKLCLKKRTGQHYAYKSTVLN